MTTNDTRKLSISSYEIIDFHNRRHTWKLRFRERLSLIFIVISLTVEYDLFVDRSDKHSRLCTPIKCQRLPTMPIA